MSFLEKYKASRRILETASLSLKDIDSISRHVAREASSIEDAENISNLVKSGKSLDYAIGSIIFLNSKILVNENVLIPRSDTEYWLSQFINFVKVKNIKHNKILDLCSGSGCIGISVKKSLCSSVSLADISHSALKISKESAKINLIDLEFIQTDMFKNILEKYDIIISNPPYVEQDNIVKTDEPDLALYGGIDGLDFYKLIAAESENYLNKDGLVVLEIGKDQHNKIIEIFNNYNFDLIESIKDINNIIRCLIFRINN